MSVQNAKRWWMRGLAFAVWTFLGVFTASQAYLILYSARLAGPYLPKETPAASWWELLQLQLAEWYIWGLLSLIVFWLARRFPLEREAWRRSLLVHLPASIVLAFAETTLSALASEVLRQAIPKPTISWSVLLLFFTAKFHQNFFIYWVLVAVHQALHYYRKFQERELRASQLEARLAQTRLQVLQMQLHPHFLFNTLNAISALIHQDVELADQMIARLGDLLRATLDNANRHEVALCQELDFVRPYLEIEQARLGDRLAVRVDVDPATLDALVPNLLLQPLVENAVRHGIAPRPQGGCIEIRARRDGSSLHLEVRDDGLGFDRSSGPFPEGVGLSNTRARLRQLYGASHRLELLTDRDRGLAVRVTIPFRERAESVPHPLESNGAHSNPDRG
jgi:two-component sensor histidine kinase